MNKNNNFLVIGRVAKQPEEKSLRGFTEVSVVIETLTTQKANEMSYAYIPVISRKKEINDKLWALNINDTVEVFGEIRTSFWTNQAGKELTFFSFNVETITKTGECSPSV